MTDILIGAADLYTYKDVRPWMQSARESGFDGDIYLICYRIDNSVREEAAKWNVELYEVNHDPYGREIIHAQRGSPTQAHNLRFYHTWELLTRLVNDDVVYNIALMTDVRDVVFQKNPILFTSNLLHGGIVAPSEHIKYNDEAWNKNNLLEGFGQLLWDLEAHEWTAYNVGTIAGQAADMRALCQLIYRMTENRSYPSDQSSFNVIVNSGLFYTIRADESIAWAAQMGTTNDPTKSYLWKKCCEPRPQITENGTVLNSAGIPFVLLHQWDRVPKLKELITKKYNL